jgi:hypothetical protein
MPASSNASPARTMPGPTGVAFGTTGAHVVGHKGVKGSEVQITDVILRRSVARFSKACCLI